MHPRVASGPSAASVAGVLAVACALIVGGGTLASAGRPSKAEEQSAGTAANSAWPRAQAFRTELQSLIHEVDAKIEAGLNYSFSRALEEDARYKALRERLRKGLEDFT